jgi:hypothetical protein
MFTVHLDESHGRANAYTVAGYVATVEQWTELEREWLELCKDVNVRYIHKRELEHQRGEFEYLRDLPKHEADEIMFKVNRVAPGIILRRVNAGFAASVYKSDWLEADKGIWANSLGKSFYAAGAFACFRLIATWIAMYNRQDPIRYVLESGPEGRDEVEAMLRRLDSNPKTQYMARMGGWSFEHKTDREIRGVQYKGVVQLQAADFLAYEMYRHMDNRVVQGIKRKANGDEIPSRYPLIRLLQQDRPQLLRLRHYRLPTPYFMLFLDKPKIAELVQYLDDTLGSFDELAIEQAIYNIEQDLHNR